MDEGEKQVALYDLSGKLIYEDKFTGFNASLELNAISSGIYFIRIIDQTGKIYKQKLIKN